MNQDITISLEKVKTYRKYIGRFVSFSFQSQQHIGILISIFPLVDGSLHCDVEAGNMIITVPFNTLNFNLLA